MCILVKYSLLSILAVAIVVTWSLTGGRVETSERNSVQILAASRGRFFELIVFRNGSG